MGLTSPDDLIDLHAMDTAEEVVTKIVKHDMYYPMRSLEDRPQEAIAETPVEVST
jgi:hypothetical protein